MSVSVIIVSRHRAAALQRCIIALLQQDHTQFEVIVVADPSAAVAARAMSCATKVIDFDQPNISAARNAGLAEAAGEIVAFIDDDAVPEATWLTRLVAPLQIAAVSASTGFVLGRNGISYQWRACEVDASGQDHELMVATTTILQGTPQRAVKTQGTNCAFRRDVLNQIGGFDPAFRFYLDEADVNLRMAALGGTAIVPDALVHHGFAASERRTPHRVPRSLFEIAASTAVFLRRHNKKADLGAAFAELQLRETARVERHRTARRLNAAQGAVLLRSLQDGWNDGLIRTLDEHLRSVPSPAPFVRFPSLGPMKGRVIAGRIWQKATLLAEARNSVGKAITTVICLSPTAMYHRVEFQPEGFWLQTGGMFGKSDRSGKLFQAVGFRGRVLAETKRIEPFRPTE